MIKDIRTTPSPPDFPVIREPGNFTGWTLTVELESGPLSALIMRTDTPIAMATKLIALAEEIAKTDAAS